MASCLLFSALWNELLPQPMQNCDHTADTQTHNFWCYNCHLIVGKKKSEFFSGKLFCQCFYFLNKYFKIFKGRNQWLL